MYYLFLGCLEKCEEEKDLKYIIYKYIYVCVMYVFLTQNDVNRVSLVHDCLHQHYVDVLLDVLGGFLVEFRVIVKH